MFAFLSSVSGRLLLLFLCLGLWCCRQFWVDVPWQLQKPLIKQPVLITGHIVDLPKHIRHGVSFFFETDHFNGASRNLLLRLNWYRNQAVVIPGDHWQLTVRLKPPTGLYNPGVFDYRQWLIHHGVAATGYVSSGQWLSASNFWTVDRWRLHLQQIIRHVVTDPKCAALVAAITVGSHALIQADQWQVFQRTGTNHLMAISGLHIGMLAGFAFWFVGILWRLYPRCLLWIPVQPVQAFFALWIAVCYGVFAGFALPTQRAVIMVVMVMLATVLRRATPVWRRLLLAFIIIFLMHPFVWSSASLWLSFGSVFWILYVLGGRVKPIAKWSGWCRLQCGLLIGLAPFTLLYFQQLSCVAFVANALSVPYVGFVIVPLCFIAAVCQLCHWGVFAGYLFYGIGVLVWPLWQGLLFLSQPHWAVWHHAIATPWIFVATLIAAGILLMPRGIPGRWLGLLCLLPLFYYKSLSPKAGGLWVTVLDVGQGLSVVVRTAQHTLLYDAGPKSYGGFDAGQAVVVPYLRKRQISQLDSLMISHGDSDHIGGANAVLHALSVHQILTSVPARFNQGAACHAGQRWIWEGVKFQVLSPLPGRSYRGNNSSCVLWIQSQHGSILLTGDIGRSVERQLIARYPQLRATALVAAHHGSRTSSSWAFIQTLRPKVVVFPVGAYNRFHFPAAEVVARYQKIGAKLFNTGFQGAITIHFAKTLQVHAFIS